MAHYGVSGNNIGSGSPPCRQNMPTEIKPVQAWKPNLFGQQSMAPRKGRVQDLGLVASECEAAAAVLGLFFFFLFGNPRSVSTWVCYY